MVTITYVHSHSVRLQFLLEWNMNPSSRCLPPQPRYGGRSRTHPFPKWLVSHSLLPLFQEYPFVLDPFQREALRCIESNQSVLVSAHTSAGKTVVAEYAIATSLRDTQRVIYTTPIKVCFEEGGRRGGRPMHPYPYMHAPIHTGT